MGQYALVAACATQGFAAGETSKEALKKVLAQWNRFEGWAEKRKENKGYKINGSFEHTNYYKSPAVGQDISDYVFIF